MGWHARVPGAEALKALAARNDRLGFPEHYLYIFALATQVDDRALEFLNDYAFEIDALTGNRILFVTFYNEAWLQGSPVVPSYPRFDSAHAEYVADLGTNASPIEIDAAFDRDRSIDFYGKVSREYREIEEPGIRYRILTDQHIVPTKLYARRFKSWPEEYQDERDREFLETYWGSLFIRSMTYESNRFCLDLGLDPSEMPAFFVAESLNSTSAWILPITTVLESFTALRSTIGRFFAGTRKHEYYRQLDHVHAVREHLYAYHSNYTFAKEALAHYEAGRRSWDAVSIPLMPECPDSEVRTRLERLRGILNARLKDATEAPTSGNERITRIQPPGPRHSARAHHLHNEALNRLTALFQGRTDAELPQVWNQAQNIAKQLPNFLTASDGEPVKRHFRPRARRLAAQDYLAMLRNATAQLETTDLYAVGGVGPDSGSSRDPFNRQHVREIRCLVHDLHERTQASLNQLQKALDSLSRMQRPDVLSAVVRDYSGSKLVEIQVPTIVSRPVRDAGLLAESAPSMTKEFLWKHTDVRMYQPWDRTLEDPSSVTQMLHSFAHRHRWEHLSREALSGSPFAESFPYSSREANTEQRSISAFISYTHESPEHSEKMLELAQNLRRDGIDCSIDQFVNGRPDEGWPLWMEKHLEDSDYILIMFTPQYIKRWKGTVGSRGRGAAWESAISRQFAYEAASGRMKIVPLLRDDAPDSVIPVSLRSQGYFRVMSQYEALLRYITSQPAVAPAPVHQLRRLGKRRG